MESERPVLGERAFFDRLAGWKATPEVQAAFERVLDRPSRAPAPEFQRRLYFALVDYLLERLRLPHSAGASEWEWRELYRFGLETDPYYFTEASLQALLAQWPALNAEARRILVSVLTGYFGLRREGFPRSFPSARLPPQEVERWTRLFPPEWCWSSMRVLHRLGLLTAGSILGFRAFSRFTDGVFEPEPTPAALRRFQAVCWQADALACGEREGADIPYRASVLASVFGGGLQALGIQAVCTALPACERCPLAEDCRWCHGTAAQATGASEIQALARNGAAKHLGTDQLLQGLFDLEDDARAALHSRLATTPLRRLAAQAPPELQGWLDGSAVPPEKLLLVFELCRRFNEERLEVGVAFQTPWDLFKHFRMRLRDLKQEQFIAVLLDNKKRYLSDHVITQGTLDASPVHPREVFLAAIRESAAALVIVHNHPSGDPKPSRDDIEVTLQLRQVGQLVGIPVVDHVIIAGDTYASLLDLGLLEK